MILARASRRAFELHGPLPEPCVALLHADAAWPRPPLETSLIEVADLGDGLFSMVCSWGRHLTGSGRALAVALDFDILQLVSRDEGASPWLQASVLRLDGARVLVVGETGVLLSDLVVALLSRGAAFEGTGRAFLHAEGVVPHPVKPRLRLSSVAAMGFSVATLNAATLMLSDGHLHCAIDPTFAGADWSVSPGAIDILLFVERNEGGRSAIAPVRAEPALSRLMRSLRFPQPPRVRDLARIRSLIDSAALFRMVMGDVARAADLFADLIGRTQTAKSAASRRT